MDLQAFINSSTGNLNTAKRAQEIQNVGRNHSAVARCLERYLKHEAAAKIERYQSSSPVGVSRLETLTRVGNLSARQPADSDPKPESAPAGLAPCPGEEHPQPRSTKYARLAEESLGLAHWELTSYVWSIDNLASDLAAAMRRSCRFLATLYSSPFRRPILSLSCHLL